MRVVLIFFILIGSLVTEVTSTKLLLKLNNCIKKSGLSPGLIANCYSIEFFQECVENAVASEKKGLDCKENVDVELDVTKKKNDEGREILQNCLDETFVECKDQILCPNKQLCKEAKRWKACVLNREGGKKLYDSIEVNHREFINTKLIPEQHCAESKLRQLPEVHSCLQILDTVRNDSIERCPAVVAARNCFLNDRANSKKKVLYDQLNAAQGEDSLEATFQKYCIEFDDPTVMYCSRHLWGPYDGRILNREDVCAKAYQFGACAIAAQGTEKMKYMLQRIMEKNKVFNCAELMRPPHV